LQTEIDILKKVDHPNVIKLHEVQQTKDRLYLIMELVTGGELFDRIVEKEAYSELDAAKVVLRIVNALDYLHKEGIVHRDLKPRIYC
jgi:serine/threonine protein kinase